MMTKLTTKDLVRFTITVAEANKNHITIDDLKGITEIIPNKKYRIVLSNGFNKDGSRNRISETFNGTLLQTIERKYEIKKELEELHPDANSTFEEFSKLYVKYLEGKVKNNQIDLTTYEGYYNLLRLHILPYLGNRIIKDITTKNIENWIGDLQQKKTKKGTGLHPTTIAHCFKLLNNMFNFAKLEKILKENPCEYVSKKPTEQPEEKQYFTLEEMDYVKELLMNSNIRFKTAMFLTMDTGCRREEIIGLTWENVDLVNKTIFIKDAIVVTSNNAPLKHSRIRKKGVKSVHSERKIRITNVCANLLSQYKNFKSDSGLRVKDNDYVFTNWDSNKVWDPNRFTAEWNTFRKENNIKKNVTIHGLRHSNATFLLSIGIPKKDVAKRLGHTPEVLDRVYTHSGDEEDKVMINKIEQNFYEKKSNYFSIYSITSVIAGYIDNEYKNENYKLLDYLTEAQINQDNLAEYLEPCQNYLLQIYPILDIFKDKNIVPDENALKNRMANYVNFLGVSNQIPKPEENIVPKTMKL